MINHARTLLLNINADRTQMQDIGYEYIPPAFSPVSLDSTLSAIRRTLFGAAPDNYFLNMRARELMGYIHETELAQYVYDLDPRVTYWPPKPDNFFENAKTRVTITQIAGAPLQLNFGGTFAANNATGTSTQTYDIVLNNIADVLSVDTQQTTKNTAVTTTLIQTTDTEQIIRLAETNLQIALNVPNSLLSLLVGPAVARWQITVRANPAPAIANIPLFELLGEPLFLELFGLSGKEPYATFKNIWEDHPLPAYRLAGLVLAVIYRTDERMRSNNG